MHFHFPLLPGMRYHYKTHPQYMVLQGVVMCGTLMGAMYGLRVAAKEPEVTWNHHTNLEPWNAYANKQYKFLPLRRDNSIECPAPKFY